VYKPPKNTKIDYNKYASTLKGKNTKRKKEIKKKETGHRFDKHTFFKHIHTNLSPTDVRTFERCDSEKKQTNKIGRNDSANQTKNFIFVVFAMPSKPATYSGEVMNGTNMNRKRCDDTNSIAMQSTASKAVSL